MLTHLSLFSGIGGFDIAAEWAGFRTICHVEIDPFCQKVLRRHWPDVPLIEDIKDVTREKVLAYANGERHTSSIREKSIARECEKASDSQSGSRSEDGRNISRADSEKESEPTVDLITAGVPCQPISVAGKRRGADDDRWLWSETIRVLSEVKSTWACFENPSGILTMGFDDLLAQMEECGYEVQAFIVPACAVNAPHRRDRVWIIAHATDNGQYRDDSSCDNEGQIAKGGKQPRDRGASRIKGCGEDVADTKGNEDRGLQQRQLQTDISTGSDWRGEASWWAVEPDVGRVAHGVPLRVDRLRALGNAVVPQQAYPILKAIADTYRDEG